MEDKNNQSIRLFWTDGSAKPNPGKGGFAVLEKKGGLAVPVVMGNCPYTTSVRMEGRALIECLKYVGNERCKIFTDSKFWINVLKKWAPTWERYGWKKATPGPIKNLDLVKELYYLFVKSNAKICWVKGHAGSRFNNLADKYAKRANKGRIESHLNKTK